MRRSLIVLVLLCAVAPFRATDAQAQSRRQEPPLMYARLGHGVVFADRTHQMPAIGFGLRAELDDFALDVSILNLAIAVNRYQSFTGVIAGSRLRLEALRFITPDANRSAYVGGGLSWGTVSVDRVGQGITATSWHGDGLQGELTAGYELARGSGARIFAQADAALPLFRATSLPYSYPAPAPGPQGSIGLERRYVPSVVLSIGVGWQRGRP